MTTIADIIQDNPLYSEGFFFNRDFFKNALPQDSTTLISQEKISYCYKMVIVAEIVHKVSSWALGYLCCKAVGLGPWLGISGASFLATLTKDTRDDEGKHYGYFEKLHFKAQLLAGLSVDEATRIVVKDVLFSTALKVMTLFASFIPHCQKPICYLALTYQAHRTAQLIESQLLSWAEFLARRSHLEYEGVKA